MVVIVDILGRSTHLFKPHSGKKKATRWDEMYMNQADSLPTKELYN